MSINTDQFVHGYTMKMAPDSQRQMPVYSQVGKGLRGDSAALILNEEGEDSSIICQYQNMMTQTVSEVWELPLMNLVPRMHYEVWRGIREIDGELWQGYYIKFSCDITIDDDTVQFWQFDTPFTATSPFYGTTIPTDYKIDSDQ